MPKTKVCHFTSVHPAYDTRIFYKECCSLAIAGYDTVLIAPDCIDTTKNGVNIKGVSNIKGGRIKRFIFTAWRTYKKAIATNSDIYHFHDPELLPYGLLLKWRGKAVIYDVHEDVPEDILTKDWIPFFARKLIAVVFKSFENWAAKHMSYVITATPFIRDRFLRLRCNALVVHNYPILNELFLPEWSRKERAVCYVGGISDIRGVFEMIEAIGRTDAKLLLAGQFSPINQDQRDKASLLSGWGKVEELGYLNRDGVKQTLARAMAGLVILHPVINHIDSLPVKMFEYMAAGIPVIASNFPLWREIIERNNCGICVNPLDSAEIAAAITWICDHPMEAKVMGENGRHAVVEQYNWEREKETLLQIYKSLVR